MRLPLLPLRDVVVFPTTMVPLYVGRDKSLASLEESSNKKQQIFLVAQKDAKGQVTDKNSIYEYGTICDIIQTVKFPDGTVKAMVEAKSVARVKDLHDLGKFFAVDVEEISMKVSMDENMTILVKTIRTNLEELAKLNSKINAEMMLQVESATTWKQLAYIIVANLNVKLETKQEVLEQTTPNGILEKILAIIAGEIEVIRVERKIQNRVKKQVEKSQKEYYLTEQMEAIQKELGGKDDGTNELEELLIKAKAKNLSEEALTKATKEIKKLKMMSPMSAESTVVRNYVETLLSLPWKDYAPENRDIAHAESVLNKDHYGLEKVKDRILEQLAVLQLNPDAKGSVICLVGPPGVGKTSLAKSIAEAQGRPFVRISLGGVRDEAEIRGHRRTYVGAMPGKIIQALRKTSKGNPVVLLDEIDKMSSDYKGDPASAMLEVLDPEQNSSFQDHYLEVEYDLSKVLFFATANYYENIPRPLLDRMEVIQLAGYTEEEKFQIAKTYLIPKQIKDAGLPKVTIKDDAIKKVISHYTKEAGVRRLERTFGTLARKLARKAVTSKVKIKSFVLTKKSIVDLLGPEKYKATETSKENEIGTVNGMAWTEVGGDLLKIEATIMPGKGALQITGQLGDVMKESAQAAVSYVRSRSALFDIGEEFFQKNDIHIHVPEGATPKDGPSAGIALTTALVSAITKHEVRRNVAMTGEVTLRGNVLPIGGLKEKILAAARAGVDTIIIPKENEKDLKDIPNDVISTLSIHPVKHVDEVLIRALNIKNPRELFKVTVSKQYGVKSQYE